MRIKVFTSLSIVACALGLFANPAFSQSNQAIFQDERQMEMDANRQSGSLQQQEQQALQQYQTTESKDEPYRLYAEKRITELQKMKAAGGSPSRSYAKQSGEL